jgi:hypothetical protein
MGIKSMLFLLNQSALKENILVATLMQNFLHRFESLFFNLKKKMRGTYDIGYVKFECRLE